MKKAIILISFLLLTELFLQGYHALFQSTLFFRHSYEQSKGKAYGEDYSFHLNSQGFKDLEFGEKIEGQYRILAIGDSFAFGSVPYKDTFLTILENKLNHGPTKVELLNMGVPSLPPQEYLALLGIEGVKLKPDLLLLSFFVGDDFSDSKAAGFLDNSALIALGKKILDKKKVYSGKIYHQSTYCDTCSVLESDLFFTIEAGKRYLFEKNNKLFAKQLDNAKYQLSKIQKLCTIENIELLVIIIPDVIQVDNLLEQRVKKQSHHGISGNSWNISQPNQMLGNWLRSEDIAFLDLYPALKNSPPPIYRINDVHWNLAGNKHAAEIVSSALFRSIFSGNDSNKHVQ